MSLTSRPVYVSTFDDRLLRIVICFQHEVHRCKERDVRNKSMKSMIDVHAYQERSRHASTSSLKMVMNSNFKRTKNYNYMAVVHNNLAVLGTH